MMLGYLAQAFDEAVPDGATGMDAALAIKDFLEKAGYVIIPKNHRPANVTEATAYLVDGGIGETLGLAYIASDARSPKVQMDTDMAIALCQLADEAIRRRQAH